MSLRLTFLVGGGMGWRVFVLVFCFSGNVLVNISLPWEAVVSHYHDLLKVFSVLKGKLGIAVNLPKMSNISH